MESQAEPQKVIVIGAGPVGALAALYAATRGDHVEIYELRGGMSRFSLNCHASLAGKPGKVQTILSCT